MNLYGLRVKQYFMNTNQYENNSSYYYASCDKGLSRYSCYY